MAEELLPCPREPDGKMLAAGRDALEPYVGNLKQPIKDQWELARLVWEAMTEARPSSQPLMGDREKIAVSCIGLVVPAWATDDKISDVTLSPEAGHIIADAILASLPAQGGERHWRDKDDQWTEAIDAAHPVNSTHPERHKLYEQAMEMVGNRHGKGALVNLVSWLLQQAHPVPEQSVDVTHGDVRVWQHEGVWIAHDTKRDIQVQADNLAKLCAFFSDAVFLDPGAHPVPEQDGWRELPVDADDELTRLLDGVTGVVEANSFERHMLWDENRRRQERVGSPPREWIANNCGRGWTVGLVHDMPVFISMFTAQIDGQKVLFVDTTSVVVDHRMVRSWLEKALPKSAWDGDRLNLTDANNFHNVFRSRRPPLPEQEAV